MHMLDKKNQLIAAALLLMTSACGKKKAETVAPPPPPRAIAPAPTPEQPKEKPVYVYSGDRFRDPFTPAGVTANYQPDAIFDPQRAGVKGIIYGPDSKSAILTVGGTGTYFAKGGRIFDIMGKTVEGYSAKILVDKVVITGEADNVFELKIKETEQEGKTP